MTNLATLTSAEIALISGKQSIFHNAKKAIISDVPLRDLVSDPVTPVPAMDGPTPEMDKLIQVILSTKRCHSSTGELNFVAWLYKALETMGHKGVAMAEGAVVVAIGTSKTLFSCHLDTVHPMAECDGSLQELVLDPAFGHIFIADKSKSSCLGADDGAGIYILLKMIEANVSGTYIFHRGEEKGGISAHAMLKKHEVWLRGFDTCIAFDRADDFEVICSQGGSVCASPVYGKALAEALTVQGLKYEVSHGGSFTDSKVYRGVIAECINIGVGYKFQHSSSEYLDWEHLQALTKAVIAIDWAALKPVRVPVSDTPVYKPNQNSNVWKGGKGYYDEDAYDFRGKKPVVAAVVKPTKQEKELDLDLDLDIDFEAMTRAEIDEYTDDELMTNGIMRLIVELDAERARVTRLQMLLGM